MQVYSIPNFLIFSRKNRGFLRDRPGFIEDALPLFSEKTWSVPTALHLKNEFGPLGTGAKACSQREYVPVAE